MRFRRQVLPVAVGLVLISGVIFPFLGGEFIPRLDEGDILIETILLPSISLKQAMKTTSQVEKVSKNFSRSPPGCFKVRRSRRSQRFDEP
jgi:cobalt-zinc-cadmium resistance protein CzcA